MARVANYFAELPYRNSALATLIALKMSCNYRRSG